METSSRLRRIAPGMTLCLTAIVLSGGLSWVVLGERPMSSAESEGPLAAHAVWTRHENLADLMHTTEVVVRGKVLDVEPYPPITWRDAGAAEGAPELPRKLITFRTDEQLFGPGVGDTFTVLHTLPPAGTILTEDPLYVRGEDSLLFLRTAQGPKGRAEVAGALSVVGIDGRYGIARTGELRPALGGGPVQEVQQARQNPQRFKEAKQ